MPVSMLITRLLAFIATRFGREERGATAVEYALVVAGIAVVVGVAAATLGGNIADMFTDSVPAAD